MKVSGSFALGLILMIGSTNLASAATKCVALNSSSRCTGSPNSFSEKVDWKATCNNIPITGVGVCSSTAGSKIGQTADSIAVGNTTDVNTYCWCKMTIPAVSRFVYVSRMPSAAVCSADCALICVNNVISDASFRAGMFSNLQ